MEMVLCDDGDGVDACHTTGMRRLGKGVPAPDLATTKISFTATSLSAGDKSAEFQTIDRLHLYNLGWVSQSMNRKYCNLYCLNIRSIFGNLALD